MFWVLALITHSDKRADSYSISHMELSVSWTDAPASIFSVQFDRKLMSFVINWLWGNVDLIQHAFDEWGCMERRIMIFTCPASSLKYGAANLRRVCDSALGSDFASSFFALDLASPMLVWKEDKVLQKDSTAISQAHCMRGQNNSSPQIFLMTTQIELSELMERTAGNLSFCVTSHDLEPTRCSLFLIRANSTFFSSSVIIAYEKPILRQQKKIITHIWIW